MRYFLYREWWAYVLDDSRADKDYGPIGEWFPLRNPWSGDWITNPFARPVNWLARVICRWRGHPAGVYFYNVGGTEPDMHCKGCGEDLG